MKLQITYDKEIPSLTKNLLSLINESVNKAEKIANNTLFLAEDVEIFIDNNMDMVDNNIGIGGYTVGKNKVELSIDVNRKITVQEMFAALVHEMSHVKRAYGPWCGETLFDYIVFEGLAMCFEEEICGKNTYYPAFIRKQHDKPERLVQKFKFMFDYDDNQYDYMDFSIGNQKKGIPEFAVYILGLFIIEKYLKKHKKRASDLLLEPAETFKEIVT